MTGMDPRWWAEVGQREQEHYRRQSVTATTPTTQQEHDMPKIGDMLESKYLKQSDIEDEVIVTISKVGKVNLSREDEEPEYKWAMRFEEFSKPMVLNSTNIQLAAKALGSDDTDDWIGKEIVLYVDPNVSYGGKLVGGLRLRAVRKAAKPAAAAKQTTAGGMDDMDSDIPFANPYRGKSSYVV